MRSRDIPLFVAALFLLAVPSCGATNVTQQNYMLLGGKSGALPNAKNITPPGSAGIPLKSGTSGTGTPVFGPLDLNGGTSIWSNGLPFAQGGITGGTDRQSALNALMNFSSVSKGDLGVFNGTNWVRLPHGADGTYFKYDSSQSTGVTADTPSSGSTAIPSTNDFRMTLTSGVFNTTSDVTGAGTGYLTPGNGGRISTYDSSVWVTHQSGEISLAIPSDAYRMFDRYVYFNGTNLVLEDTPWDASRVTGTITGATAAAPCVLTASNTLSAGDIIAIDGIVGTLGTNTKQGLNGKFCYVSARTSTTITLEGMDTSSLTYTSGGTWYKIPTAPSTAPTKQDYVWCKTGALDRRWVGRFMTLAAGTTEDSAANSLWDNVDNAVARPVSCHETGSSWSLGVTNTALPPNLDTAAGLGRVVMVKCFSSLRNFRDYATSSGFSGGYNYQTGLNLTRVASNIATMLPIVAANGPWDGGNGNGVPAYLNAEYALVIPAGFSWLQRMETAGCSGAAAAPRGVNNGGCVGGLQNGLVGTVTH